MPSWILPSDAHAAGDTGHVADHNHIVDDLTILRNAQTDWFNVVTQYGADPTGVSDSTTAIQSALNAAPSGAVIFFPAGTYKITTPLTIPSNVIRLTGSAIAGGSVSSTATAGAALVNSSGGVINDNFANSHAGLEIDHLQMEATGGHVISGLNMTQNCFIHDLRLIQNSAGFSIWDHNGTQAGNTVTQYCFLNHWSDIECLVFGATRTVPAWNFYNLGNAYFTDNVFERVSFNNQGNDASQFLVYIASQTSLNGSNYDITFRECFWSQAYGGCLAAYSVMGLRVIDCGVDNYLHGQTGGGALTNSAFYVSTASGSRRSGMITFRGLVLDTPPSAADGAGSGWYGINLDSTVDTVMIDACGISAKLPSDGGAATNQLYVNVGSANNVTIISPQPAVSVTGGTGNTHIVGNGDDTMGGFSIISGGQQPGANGLLAWNFDPATSNSGGVTPVSGTIYSQRIDVYKPLTVGHLLFNNLTAGSGATAGQNFVALYNSSGTQLASAGIDTQGVASGTSKITITAQSITPGTYYVFWLVNATGMPSTMRATGNPSQMNLNTSAATLRTAVYATLQTALPSPATMSNLVATNALALWMGLAV